MKKTFTIFIGGLLIFWLLFILTGYTFIIPISKYHSNLTKSKKGRIVTPFKNFDLSRGSWKAYIVISPSDYKNLDQIGRAHV